MICYYTYIFKNKDLFNDKCLIKLSDKLKRIIQTLKYRIFKLDENLIYSLTQKKISFFNSQKKKQYFFPNPNNKIKNKICTDKITKRKQDILVIIDYQSEPCFF